VNTNNSVKWRWFLVPKKVEQILLLLVLCRQAGPGLQRRQASLSCYLYLLHILIFPLALFIKHPIQQHYSQPTCRFLAFHSTFKYNLSSEFLPISIQLFCLFLTVLTMLLSFWTMLRISSFVLCSFLLNSWTNQCLLIHKHLQIKRHLNSSVLKSSHPAFICPHIKS